MDAPNLNQLWADLIVEELTRNNVRHFIVAPGSRSAPLAAAAARNRRAVLLTHYDERGAAFVALGSGRMGKTAAVICTSGTAAANCFPAVAEARQSAIPLVIVSADRPPELQDCGANQTMPQHNLFGHYVHAQMTIPCPTTSCPPEAVLTQVNALTAAAGEPGRGGPVHLNCMYREPLAPDVVPDAFSERYTAGLSAWHTGTMPFTRWERTAHSLSESQLAHLVNALAEESRGVLLAGRLYSREESDAVLALARRLQWPLFADITSGCRRETESVNLVPCHDALLGSKQFRAAWRPDFVLHFGDAFVSKRLHEYLAGVRPKYIQVTTRDENRDPAHLVTQRYQVDIAQTCRQITERLASASAAGERTACFSEISPKARACLTGRTGHNTTFTDQTVAAVVNAFCRPDRALFLGNSMPVRVMDITAAQCDASVVHANRGVSGIDGNIATAAGMAWASGAPVLAMVGDMTALHDLNSLALLANTPVILVIVNNQGGGIFSLLPIAKYKDLLEPYFIQRHEWRFEHPAATYGLAYSSATNAQELEQALRHAVAEETPMIIEAVVNHEANVQAYKTLLRDVADTVDSVFARSIPEDGRA